MSAEPSTTLISGGSKERCPHLVARNLLGAETVERLLEYVAQIRDEFRPAAVYRGDHAAGVADRTSRNCLRRPTVGPFEETLKPIIDALLPRALRPLGLLEPSAVAREFEFCAYGDGGLFAEHHDILPGGRPRIVSCVYYFCREPSVFRGGELRLFAWPGVPRATGNEAAWVDLAPACDSLVMFPSALRHEVRLVRCPSGDWCDQRFTINCWAYRSDAATLEDT
jgi:predicted 2-oxoglutarate/Fe(II)-dependent dioxygenase YbiX